MTHWWLTADTKANVRCGTNEPVYEFRGEPRKDQWIMPSIECKGLSYKPKDFVSFSSSTAFLVSERVAEFIDSNLPDHAEFLSIPPLAGRKYFVANIIKLAAGLIDLQLSNLQISKSGEIYDEDGIIIGEGLQTPSLFKISECPGKVFINEHFREYLERQKFSGMLFYNTNTSLQGLFSGNALYERPSY